MCKIFLKRMALQFGRNIILLLQLYWLTVQAQNLDIDDPALNVSSSIQDYITENQRQYSANIVSFDKQIATYRKSYQQQVNTVAALAPLVEERQTQFETKYIPLELLGGLSKHCVQKYQSRVLTISGVRSSLTSCVNAATNNMNTYIAPAETTSRNLNSYYNNQLKTGLTDCQKKHSNAYFNYTLCVQQVINAANAVTISNQKSFDVQLQQAYCSAETRIKQAVDCSFITVNNAITLIAESSRLIDNCIAGLEYCPPCREDGTPVDTAPSCDNVVDFMLTPVDSRNATIHNPFYGLSANATCLLINIQRPV